jgi:hypothetical protein
MVLQQVGSLPARASTSQLPHLPTPSQRPPIDVSMEMPKILKTLPESLHKLLPPHSHPASSQTKLPILKPKQTELVEMPDSLQKMIKKSNQKDPEFPKSLQKMLDRPKDGSQLEMPESLQKMAKKMKGSKPRPELPKSLTEEKAKKQNKKGPRPIIPLPKTKEIGKISPKTLAQPNNVYVGGKLEIQEN